MKNRLSNTVTTLIGADATITGNVEFKQSCHVAGVVKGDVTASLGKKTELTVAQSGRIEGNAQAARLLVQGNVVGDLRCSGTLTLAATAQVEGSIEYGQIEIEKGAVVKGNLVTPSTESRKLMRPTKRLETKADTAKQAHPAVS